MRRTHVPAAMTTKECQNPHLQDPSAFTSAPQTNYCGSQAYCRTMKGDLLTGEEELRRLASDHVYVGLTDLLEERGKRKDGWRWNNGEVAPASIFRCTFPTQYLHCSVFRGNIERRFLRYSEFMGCETFCFPEEHWA